MMNFARCSHLIFQSEKMMTMGKKRRRKVEEIIIKSLPCFCETFHELFFFSGRKINLLWKESLEFINDDYDDDLQVACNLKLLLHTITSEWRKNYENYSHTWATLHPHKRRSHEIWRLSTTSWKDVDILMKSISYSWVFEPHINIFQAAQRSTV